MQDVDKGDDSAGYWWIQKKRPACRGTISVPETKVMLDTMTIENKLKWQ
jgi:hypothetical protein